MRNIIQLLSVPLFLLLSSACSPHQDRQVATELTSGRSEQAPPPKSEPTPPERAKKTEVTGKKKQAIVSQPISVVDLRAQYLENQIAANDRYTGRRIEVSGCTISVGEAGGRPTITISDWYSPLARQAPITCQLEPAQRAAAAKVVPDRAITLSVVCKGLVGGALTLTDGRIVHVSSKQHSDFGDAFRDPPMKDFGGNLGR